MATVSFTIRVANDVPCRAPPAWTVESPACVAIFGWRVSLNGDFADEGATPLAEGHAVYHVEDHYAQDGYITEYEVEERFVVNAPPGDHTLRLQVVKMFDVPIQRIGDDTAGRILPCGAGKRVGLQIGCYAEAVLDTPVDILPNPMMPAS